jgi:hypothetical protein
MVAIESAGHPSGVRSRPAEVARETNAHHCVVPVYSGDSKVGVACRVRLADDTIAFLTANHILGTGRTPRVLSFADSPATIEWHCEDTDLLLLRREKPELGAEALQLAFDPHAAPGWHHLNTIHMHAAIVVYTDSTQVLPITQIAYSVEHPLGTSGVAILRFTLRCNVVGVYKRSSGSDGIATSIVHLGEAGKRFKTASAAARPHAIALGKIRNDVIESAALQRLVAALLGLCIVAILATCAWAFMMMSTNYAATIGVPLIFIMLIRANKWFTLSTQMRACERDADELYFAYGRCEERDFEFKVLKTECLRLRRRVIELFNSGNLHV